MSCVDHFDGAIFPIFEVNNIMGGLKADGLECEVKSSVISQVEEGAE